MNAQIGSPIEPSTLPPPVADLRDRLDQQTRDAVDRLLKSLSPQLQQAVCKSVAVLEEQGADVDVILAAIKGKTPPPVVDPGVCQPLRQLFLTVQETVGGN